MHENDAAQGRPAPRPFMPRLVGGDDTDESVRRAGNPLPSPSARSVRTLPAHQHAELHDATVREIADSLADLFLGNEAPPRSEPVMVVSRATPGESRAVQPAPGQASRPRGATGDSGGTGRGGEAAPVEMLVLGHLPVLAGAWLTQYATQAARAVGGPVAMARLDPEGLSLDLFGLPKDVPARRHDTLDEAMAAAASLASAWLIRVDDLAEATVADSPRIGAITLLSGVSESSIVAAYRALKAIVQRAGSRGSAPEREKPAELRIALLGASAERATEASSRIRKAAATFLGRPVGVIVCAERIGLTGMRTLYRGPFEGDAARLLEVIGAAGSEAVVARAGVPSDRDGAVGAAPPVLEVSAGPAPSGPSEDSQTAARAGGNSRPTEHGAASALTEDTDWLLEPEPSVVAPARSEKEEPEPQMETPVELPSSPSAHVEETITPRESLKSGPGGGPVLPAGFEASLAQMLGLSPLPIRCPESPCVELAADAEGGLHAIVLDEVSAGTAGAKDAPAGRSGVAALLATDAWARSNMSLVQRAFSFVRGGELRLHLVTRVPAAARDLLGTRVRVHLLARATGPGDVCVGLN